MVLILLMTSILVLPWLLPDLYFFVMSLILLAKKNAPLRQSIDLEPLYGDDHLAVILIPVYNNANTVLRCLIPQIQAAFAKQGRLSISVILVDSSTDGTEEKLKDGLQLTWSSDSVDRCVALKSNLRLIHLKNRQGGKAWAINKIACELNTKYFAILDSDWVVDFNSFAKATRYLENNPQFAYAQMAWKSTDEPLNFIGGLDQVSIEYRHQLENRVRAWQGIPVTIHGTAVLVRTELFQEFHGFDESVLSEDVDLTARFILKGHFGVALCDLSMQQNPCDHLQQFFWQKARWAEGRSQMLRKYFLPTLHSPYLANKQKLFWIYYLAYFGRCVGFAVLLLLSLWGIYSQQLVLTAACLLWMTVCLVVRWMNHIVTMAQRTNKIPLLCRLLEPISFYSIGLVYSYTFFAGLFRSRGSWRLIEAKAHSQ